jgi:hypothetical protein
MMPEACAAERTSEEELFQRNRDLFTELELVFFDTTSLFFEGNGGESLGQYGHRKDHRPDLKQKNAAGMWVNVRKFAQTIAVTASTAPMDMSIPAVMRTRVKPTATMPVCEASWNNVMILSSLRNE